MLTLLKPLATLATALVMSVTGQAGPTPERLWSELPEEETAAPLEGPVNASTFAELADRLSPAVVFISVKQTETARLPRGDLGWMLPPGMGLQAAPRERQGTGSGFIIRKDGYILTNNHVVDNANRIDVRLQNGEEFAATLVGADPATDLALVRIEVDRDLPTAPLGDSDELRIGHWVLAIGNPFGLDHTVTAGIVSAKGRKELSPNSGPAYANFIQTDASINPGNSGGPLLNMRGEVVGINTAIIASGQGIGFAIPVNMVKELLPQLAQGRIERSYIGVSLQDLNQKLARSLGLSSTKGTLIAQVIPDSPAQEAGIEVGDVVTGFDGLPIESSSDLSWLASIKGAGKTVEVNLLRRGKPRTNKVTLTAHPNYPARKTDDHPKDRKAGGLAVESLAMTISEVPEKLRKSERLRDNIGAYVEALERKGAAAKAGLRPGDIILKVGYDPIKGPGDLSKALAGVTGGNPISILVLRRGATSWLTLQVD